MPNKGFSGLDEFSFKVRDPGGLASQVTTAEVNVSFKMKDLRGGDTKKKAEPKKEEEKAPAKGKRKKGKRR